MRNTKRPNKPKNWKPILRLVQRFRGEGGILGFEWVDIISMSRENWVAVADGFFTTLDDDEICELMEFYEVAQ